MPRNYVRKSLRATSYTREDVANAIDKVKRKELTLYGAAKHYNIPVATLHNRLYNKTGVRSKTLGRPPVFPYETEMKLANGLKVLEKWGFGLSRKEVIYLVECYVKMNNINNPFKNNIPGPDWFTNFCKRHGLSLKKAQSLEHSRKKNTDPFIINEYFNILKSTLNELHLEHQPHLIWNLDETSVCLDPSKTKVVGKKGAPSSRTTYGTGKENITVLTAVSANAKKISPLIIFKGKYVWDTWVAETGGKYDFELSYAASQKGWMDTQIFHNYIEKVFIPALGKERPVLLVYDGHGSHVDLNVVELAIRNNVTILKLPPHTSHILQPLDLAVFKSFKSRWDAKLVEWQRQNTGVKVPKKVFSELFAEIWNDTKDEIIINGFKKAGIYPFNPEVVPIDKYDSIAYKRWKEAQEINFQTLQRQSYSLDPQIEDTESLLFNMDTQFFHQSKVQPTQNPELLKELCINAINAQMCVNTFDFQNTCPLESVQMLSDLSKNHEQVQRFVANNEEELPKCLKSKDFVTESATASKTTLLMRNPKVTIISNETVSFEELLLETVKQTPRHEKRLKRRRIGLGAEVITETMKKDLAEKATQSALRTKLVIPKKKTPKDTKIVKEKMERKSDSRHIKKEPHSKINEVKKCQQQKKTPKILQRKRKELFSDTESSENEMEVETIETDDSDYNNMDEFIEKCLQEQNEDQENINPCANIEFGLSEIMFYDGDSNKLKKDNWILVQFVTKKTIKHFVGTILSFENQLPVVKYVRKVKQTRSDTVTSFTYPIVEDVSTVKYQEDIVSILPEPVISRRGQIKFEVDFKKYNIQ